jgi:hypothetical protein
MGRALEGRSWADRAKGCPPQQRTAVVELAITTFTIPRRLPRGAHVAEHIRWRLVLLADLRRVHLCAQAAALGSLRLFSDTHYAPCALPRAYPALGHLALPA